jgi:tRNA threonylcarbamoyladenosine biosynthesis protein TsaB
MLLLAVDTSGKDGSIALARCGQEAVCEVLEVVPLAGGTFSAQLVPQIAALLGKHGFSKQDIGGFAVVSGPGSFTGLRVGLAAIKGLAEVLQKPIATVSRLEAVAAGEGVGLAALDAGRNEIYVAEYDHGRLTTFGERLLSREQFLAAVEGRVVITPDKIVLDAALSTTAQVREIPPPRADLIARLGWKKIVAGETVSPEQLDANYIRRSDAEIFSKPRS